MGAVTADPRQNPDAAFIAELRTRFRVEPEIDRVLTRKMAQRGGAPYRPVTLDELAEALNHFLAGRLDQPFEVRDLRWMTGGSSKLQVFFALDWRGLDGTAVTDAEDRLALDEGELGPEDVRVRVGAERVDLADRFLWNTERLREEAGGLDAALVRAREHQRRPHVEGAQAARGGLGLVLAVERQRSLEVDRGERVGPVDGDAVAEKGDLHRTIPFAR